MGSFFAFAIISQYLNSFGGSLSFLKVLGDEMGVARMD